MAHIQQLEPHVADLIAAGEVVERPASVVKELVENALDAGCSAVAVEIRGGGMSLIRVTDDGCGIPPQELPTAFLRHATSKLRTEADLAGIGTLGFRGEALAAIAAVAHTEIVTRTRGAVSGARLLLEGGVPGRVESAGTPEGTTISVRDLFYNTPARLKFMKKDSAETAAVAGLMQHLALSRPDVSFKFVHDGEEGMLTPGDGKLLSAVYAALGRDFAKTLTPVSGRGGEIAVSGFVTMPLSGRGSRAMQIFFVNGRFIKSPLLTTALEEGYRNQLLKGRFPGCVLAVEVPVGAVDVNVHPAKTVVKFAREHDVFDAVFHTVLDALDSAPGPAAPAGRAEAAVNPRQDFFQHLDAGAYRARTGEGAAARPAWDTERRGGSRVADSAPGAPAYTLRTPPISGAVKGRPDSAGQEPPAAESRPPAPASRPAADKSRPSPAAAAAVPDFPARPGTQTPPAIPAQRPFTAAIPGAGAPTPEVPGQQTLAAAGETPWRIAGEVLRTYIVCEAEDGTVWLIDKHAAHERINFDRLMAAKTPPLSQQLLQPAAVELGREDAALVLENLPLLASLGFSCEAFGGGTVLVRAVPADLDAEDAAPTLEELAEQLRTGRSPEERRQALLHTMACKSAVKAGMHSDPRELRVLVDRVQSGEIRYCPHGRPVAARLTRYELEKMFKRA